MAVRDGFDLKRRTQCTDHGDRDSVESASLNFIAWTAGVVLWSKIMKKCLRAKNSSFDGCERRFRLKAADSVCFGSMDHEDRDSVESASLNFIAWTAGVVLWSKI